MACFATQSYTIFSSSIPSHTLTSVSAPWLSASCSAQVAAPYLGVIAPKLPASTLLAATRLPLGLPGQPSHPSKMPMTLNLRLASLRPPKAIPSLTLSANPELGLNSSRLPGALCLGSSLLPTCANLSGRVDISSARQSTTEVPCTLISRPPNPILRQENSFLGPLAYPDQTKLTYPPLLLIS